MITSRTTLYKYIQSNKDDSYALEVIYYLMRKALITNNFDIQKVPLLRINGKFRSEPIDVDIKMMPSHELDGLTLLLFIRTIMIDSSYIELCVDDLPLFRRKSRMAYEWVDWLNIIKECDYDDDFNEILECINAVNYSGSLTKRQEEEFKDKTVKPEYKFLQHYFRTMAESDESCEEVIKCNSYVCNEKIQNFVVNNEVNYIGNTAFAYCENLISITFLNPNINFGHFPIVECENLTRIFVPKQAIEYYKNELPYYANIIVPLEEQETKEVNGEASEPIVETTSEEAKEDVNIQPINETQVINEVKIVNQDRSLIYDVFKSVSTSYKFFWFLSILYIIKRKEHKTISFQEMVAEMISLAWPFIYDFELDLGKNDSFASITKALIKTTPLIEQSSSAIVRQYICNHYDVVKKNVSPLLDHVPYRFLSPWIKFSSTADVIEKSNDESYNSPYTFVDDNIVFDEDWYGYIQENIEKLDSFTKNSLLKYLEKHNSVMKLLKYKISIA